MAVSIDPNKRTPDVSRDVRWILPLARRLAEALEFETQEHLDPDPREWVQSPVTPVYGDGESAEQVGAEIFTALEKQQKNPGFESVEELVKCADDMRVPAEEGKAPESFEAFTARLAARLLEPLDTYQFDLQMSGKDSPARRAGHLLGMHLLGPYSLHIQPGEGDGDEKGLKLSGVVSAGSFYGAVHRVERVIDEFCGTLRCLGLVRFFSPAVMMFEKVSGVMLRRKGVDGDLYFALDPAYTMRVVGTYFTSPHDLYADDLKRWSLSSGDTARAFDMYHQALQALFGNNSVRAREIRAGVRRAVQAEFSSDFGLTVSLAFSCLEGLLLVPTDHEEVLGRISEAVAHALARSHHETKHLRQQVKDLYRLRSTFMHSGAARQTATSRADVLNLTYRVLRHEIDLLRGEAESMEALPVP